SSSAWDGSKGPIDPAAGRAARCAPLHGGQAGAPTTASACSGRHADDFFQPNLSAEVLVLLCAQPVREAAGRHLDVAIGDDGILGDVALDPATLHEPFGQISAGTHFVDVHRFAVRHIHA